uniref:Uncharacterized protein n=1 Tax=Arundo donax TaxID=35708 RepID=A0A0A9H0P9_ARUDO
MLSASTDSQNHCLLLGCTQSHGKQWHTMQIVPGRLLQQ